jgi:hypothetical protein
LGVAQFDRGRGGLEAAHGEFVGGFHNPDFAAFPPCRKLACGAKGAA